MLSDTSIEKLERIIGRTGLGSAANGNPPRKTVLKNGGTLKSLSH